MTSDSDQINLQGLVTCQRVHPADWIACRYMQNDMRIGYSRKYCDNGIILRESSMTMRANPAIFRVEISPKSSPKKRAPSVFTFGFHKSKEELEFNKEYISADKIACSSTVHRHTMKNKNEFPLLQRVEHKIQRATRDNYAMETTSSVHKKQEKPILRIKSENKLRISKIGLVSQETVSPSHMNTNITTPNRKIKAKAIIFQNSSFMKRACTTEKTTKPIFLNKYMANNYIITHMFNQWKTKQSTIDSLTAVPSPVHQHLNAESPTLSSLNKKTGLALSQSNLGDFALRKLNIMSRHMKVMAERRSIINSKISSPSSAEYSSHSRIYSLFCR